MASARVHTKSYNAHAMLRTVLGLNLLLACSQGPQPKGGAPPPREAPSTDVHGGAASPGRAQLITDTCATDTNCAVGTYPEIGTDCCAYRCGYDVVTESRAAARERDYKARCSQVQCQPHDCAAFETPHPVCRESRCVDQGHPGVRVPGGHR